MVSCAVVPVAPVTIAEDIVNGAMWSRIGTRWVSNGCGIATKEFRLAFVDIRESTQRQYPPLGQTDFGISGNTGPNRANQRTCMPVAGVMHELCMLSITRWLIEDDRQIVELKDHELRENCSTSSCLKSFFTLAYMRYHIIHNTVCMVEY